MMRNLSQNYANPAIAAKQRETVDGQLEAMYNGRAIRLHSLVGEIVDRIKMESELTLATLLDAACGSAYYSEIIEFLSPGWIEYTGVDYNPGMIALAHECYPGLRVVQGDVQNLQFESNSFDIVLSSATIGHVQDESRALGELARVSCSWLILHRNPIWMDGAPTACSNRQDYDVEVLARRFNEQSLVSKVSSLGMELVESYEISPPRGNKGYYTYLFRRHVL